MDIMYEMAHGARMSNLPCHRYLVALLRNEDRLQMFFIKILPVWWKMNKCGKMRGWKAAAYFSKSILAGEKYPKHLSS